jgi:carbon monoxide dehydrogenase subunit G
MELENSFTVPADIDTAWRTLLDLQTVAPCMPGATLESATGDTFTGSVKVKLGPVQMTYGGEAKFLSKDDVAKVAVIEGVGKETRGAGTAKALITTALRSEGPTTTRVDVTTDLAITGKPAQFGRGVMQDVASRLVGQFATNLGNLMAQASGAPAAATAEGAVAAPAAAPAPAKPAEALDLGSVAVVPVLKRVLPIALGVIVVAGIIWWIVASR